MKNLEKPVDQFLSVGDGDPIKAFRAYAESNRPQDMVIFRSAVVLSINPESRISESRIKKLYDGALNSDEKYLKGFESYVERGWLVSDLARGLGKDLYKFENELFSQIVPGVMGYLATNEDILSQVLVARKSLPVAIKEYSDKVANINYIV